MVDYALYFARMDIFAHGFWAAAIARGTNTKADTRIMRPWLAFLFGLFPDLFAFSVPFIVFGVSWLTGGQSFSAGAAGPPSLQSPAMLNLAYALYNVSHSLVIFALVFIIVALIRGKRPLWELSGWLFHILCDIPTHTDAFFPTPIFWPISSAHFRGGISWGQTWFMLANYSLIILAHLAITLWRRTKKHPASYATS